MRILLAEDEMPLANAVTTFLKIKGFDVDHVSNGEDAEQMACTNAYDVIVLDIMMPKKNGLDVLKELRSRDENITVLMLTAKSEIDDRIDGLSAGADDYLTKPFALRELEARIWSQIRRSRRFSAETLSYEDLTLHMGEQELSCHNAIRLSGKETPLAEYLIKNAEHVLTYEEIFHHIWDRQKETDKEMVNLYISYLNVKLKSIGSDVAISADGNICLLCRGKER